MPTWRWFLVKESRVNLLTAAAIDVEISQVKIQAQFIHRLFV